MMHTASSFFSIKIKPIQLCIKFHICTDNITVNDYSNKLGGKN